MSKKYPNMVEFTPFKSTATQLCPYEPDKGIEGYISLKSIQDDKKVLKNPHKGWYWHYIDNGFIRGDYRERHDPRDLVLDFPGLNHLYLRFDWGDIEKEEGVYDWSYIDSIMNKWGPLGYKFGIRICTYEGIESIPFATPEFVFEKGAKVYRTPQGFLEPAYDDPIFLECLDRFMAEAGRKFNKDPNIETIDVGTFGTWGEGHTAAGTNIQYGADLVIKHMDLHAKHFPDKTLMFNDDFINSCWERGVDENLRIIQRAVDLDMGIDDDSILVSCYARDLGYTSLRSPWMFDMINKKAPVALELEHYILVREEVFKDGFPFMEAMRETKATFAGFHGYPRPWLEKNRYFTEYAANRLGYWYFVNGVVAGKDNTFKCKGKNQVQLFIENRGFAPCYHKYDLKLALVNQDTRVEFHIDVDNRDWLESKESQVTCEFTTKDLAKGKYQLAIGLFEKDKPVLFGFKDGIYKEDNFAYILDVLVE